MLVLERIALVAASTPVPLEEFQRLSHLSIKSSEQHAAMLKAAADAPPLSAAPHAAPSTHDGQAPFTALEVEDERWRGRAEGLLLGSALGTCIGSGGVALVHPSAALVCSIL